MSRLLSLSLLFVLVGVAWFAWRPLDADSPLPLELRIGEGDGIRRLWGPASLKTEDTKDVSIAQGSVRIYTKDGTAILEDDSEGHLTGNGQGVVIYTDGVYWVYFTQPPAKGVEIFASFSYGDKRSSGTFTAESVVLSDTNRRGLDPQLQGNFPLLIPSYNGIEQLLVLSSKWIVVVNYNLDAVCRQINTFTTEDSSFRKDFDFLTAQLEFDQLKKQGRWSFGYDYLNFIQAAMQKYALKSRLLIDGYDEKTASFALDSPTYYAITSDSDLHYAKSTRPSRLTRFVVSRAGEVRTGFDIDYAHYTYLELPTPLQDQAAYTITLGDGKSVSFRYDEKRTVSRCIKVNQLGYLPNVKQKYAYLGGFLWEFGPMGDTDFFPNQTSRPQFSVVNVETGDVALEGPILLPKENENPRFAKKDSAEDSDAYMVGENVYVLDLSELTQPGHYFITIPGVGRSWPFAVNADLYGPAFYTAMRGMYTQRCGIALDQFAKGGWYRKTCHPDPEGNPSPTCWSQSIPLDKSMEQPAPYYENFDVNAATTNCDHDPITGPVYGWHDAADWDKNPYHYTNIFALLTLYDLFPDRFTDEQLDIPHLPDQQIGGSGDGIPDILNEAEFGLLVWKRSLSKEGGASGLWETSRHPTINDPEFRYAYSQRLRWSSFLYATAAAQLSRLLDPFDAEKSKSWQNEAILAYQFGTDPKNALAERLKNDPSRVNEKGEILIHALRDRGAGAAYVSTWTEKESYNWPYLVSAQLQLYLLTGDDSYLVGDPQSNLSINDILDFNLRVYPQRYPKVPLPLRWPASTSDYWGFLFYGLFHPAMAKTDKIPASLVNLWRDYYVDTANELIQFSKKDPYRRCRSRDDANTWWGNGTMTNYSRWILLAHALNSPKLDPSAFDVAVLNVDYQTGTNPQGMSWTTGVGYVYPIHLQHAVSEDDNITDPFPGLVLYGPNGLDWMGIHQIWLQKDSGTTIRFLNPSYYQDDRLRLPPILRRYATHPTRLVEQNEFTVHETMASNTFVTGYLMRSGWKPSSALTQRLPLDDRLLFGFWYLP